MGADSSFNEALCNVLNKALEMNTESEELAFFIRPLEIAKDEASVCTIIGDIFLLDRSMI